MNVNLSFKSINYHRRNIDILLHDGHLVFSGEKFNYRERDIGYMTGPVVAHTHTHFPDRPYGYIFDN